jgi:hypothetical protein
MTTWWVPARWNCAGLVIPILPLSTAVGFLKSNNLVMCTRPQLSKNLWRCRESRLRETLRSVHVKSAQLPSLDSPSFYSRTLASCNITTVCCPVHPRLHRKSRNGAVIGQSRCRPNSLLISVGGCSRFCMAGAQTTFPLQK